MYSKGGLSWRRVCRCDDSALPLWAILETDGDPFVIGGETELRLLAEDIQRLLEHIEYCKEKNREKCPSCGETITGMGETS